MPSFEKIILEELERQQRKFINFSEIPCSRKICHEKQFICESEGQISMISIHALCIQPNKFGNT